MESTSIVVDQTMWKRIWKKLCGVCGHPLLDHANSKDLEILRVLLTKTYQGETPEIAAEDEPMKCFKCECFISRTAVFQTVLKTAENENVFQRIEFDPGDLADTLTTMFDPIVGYDDVKWLMRKAIHTDEPVHILLEGPPASAKTLFLMEIGRLPRAYFAVGGNATKAGLTDMLMVYQPRYLLLDEVETIDNQRDYAALLHLMENQEVIETKYRRRERMPLKTWVFAAGNDASDLPPALLSRFGGRSGVVRFKEYTSVEFLEIAANVLVQRENTPVEFAKRVATATLDLGSRDVRLAVRIGRLAKNEEDLLKVVDVFRRRR